MSKITRGIRNRNPFNIKFNLKNNWKGQIPSTDKVFCQFETFDYGIRAGIVLLRNYIINGITTLPAIMSRFAPASENNLVPYLSFVRSFDVPEVLSYPSEGFYRLCAAICQYESCYKLTRKHFYNILNYYQL